MSSFQEFPLIVGAITTHAWSGDRNRLAISPNNNEVHIYKREDGGFALEHVLKEHDKLVTCLDWAPNTNRIVSCSQDRNAYVWSFDEEKSIWNPILVLLRINRAATCVRWSPREDMFAVGSGARCVSICHFEDVHNWWISKHIKKPLRSTVLSVAWHPDEPIIATGSSDFKARAFSCLIKGYGEKPHGSVWGSDFAFNTVMGEYSGVSGGSPGGWVHDVCFSPNGSALAWVSHDASINIYYPESQFLSVVKTPSLPFLKLIWLAEGTIVAAGHDCIPTIFQGGNGTSWKLVDKINPNGSNKKSALTSNSAFNKFKQMDSRKQDSASDLQLASVHQNSIIDLRIYEIDPAGTHVSKFSSCGLDGKVVIWDLNALQKSMDNLNIN